jgi:hypothetical protein
MKPIRFAAFLFYRYYSGGRRPDSTPYFSTMCAMTFLVFLHLLQILILFGKLSLIPLNASDGKGIKRVVILFIMLPIYLLMTQLVKKKRLDKMKEEYSYSWDKIFNWNVWLIVYIILSFSLIFILAFWMR